MGLSLESIFHRENASEPVIPIYPGRDHPRHQQCLTENIAGELGNITGVKTVLGVTPLTSQRPIPSESMLEQWKDSLAGLQGKPRTGAGREALSENLARISKMHPGQELKEAA
ncbi:MAG: hypothetical protein C4584_01910 [Armatimonadetes bacterium]|nr:MAG: hypothetical protein C4584_01910 [Armatimonadota bacterium]